MTWCQCWRSPLLRTIGAICIATAPAVLVFMSLPNKAELATKQAARANEPDLASLPVSVESTSQRTNGFWKLWSTWNTSYGDRFQRKFAEEAAAKAGQGEIDFGVTHTWKIGEFPEGTCESIKGRVALRYLFQPGGGGRPLLNPIHPACQNPPCFVFRHFSKCGGTFAELFLRHVIKPGSFRLVKDNRKFREYFRAPPNFVVAIMRNPCALYLSRASWNPSELLRMRGAPDAGPVVHLNRENFTHEEFKDYILAMAPRDGGKIGSLSYDFWKQFVVEESCWHPVRGHETNIQNIFRFEGQSLNLNCSRQKQLADLQHLVPSELAHCWVTQERYFSDFARCLAIFEHCFQGKGGVDWKNFSSFQAMSAQITQQSSHKEVVWTSKLPKSRDSAQQRCHSHFDKELEQFVMKLDAPLFHTFGYTQCCEGSNITL